MRFIRFFAIPLVIAAGGCDDGIGPAFWDSTPDSVTLFSISRADLIGLPSAYDVIQLRPVTVENPAATGTWDFALAEQNGQFVMVPAGSFGGITSRAGIATLGPGSLDAVTEAPRDTARFSTAPVPIATGSIYVLRSRREGCGAFGGTGVRYAKLHAVAVDAATGTFRFAVVRNPYCNDRALVPPEDED
ncbi:MAG: hypothetical protein ACREMQ_06460 [Longimicrobiales bacterium]